MIINKAGTKLANISEQMLISIKKLKDKSFDVKHHVCKYISTIFMLRVLCKQNFTNP